MAKIVSFSLEAGNKYFGKIDGTRFFIAQRTRYEGNKGLMNVTGTAAQKYNCADFRATHGFWADFIHPTAMAEGALYHTLNTYDRARFTFTFLQFAAHVPDGDFVVFLRALLKLPLAAEYFPDLVLKDNRVCRIKDGATLPLETKTSTAQLMNYLNPSLAAVEDTEVIQSAKFVHWAQNDPAHRQTQIDVGIAHLKEKVAGYATLYGLNGVDDTICFVVTDIRHQGRAKNPAIKAALRSAKPLESLLLLGEPKYHERLEVIRREIKKLVAEGTFGTHKYSTTRNDFVAK